MHRLPRKMLQHSPISFRSTKITVLNIGNTPPCLVLKSTSENHNFFLLQTFQFFLFTFQFIYEASADKTYAECFSVALKIAKKKHKKIKGTPPYLFLINNTKNFRFLFTFFKLAVAAPDTMYAPISQKYITAQSNPFQIH